TERRNFSDVIEVFGWRRPRRLGDGNGWHGQPPHFRNEPRISLPHLMLHRNINAHGCSHSFGWDAFPCVVRLTVFRPWDMLLALKLRAAGRRVPPRGRTTC